MATISDEEAKLIPQFKEKLGDVLRTDHDDHTLVKWLRARRLRVDDSVAMYRKSMEWRKAKKVDSIKQTFQQPEVMVKYYPGGVCGLDKEGRPVVIDCYGRSDMRGILSSVPRNEVIKTIVYRVEVMLDLMRSESKRQGKVINQVVQVLDMDGFGRKHIWMPGAELLQDILKTLDDNYPEMLFRTYIINAPRLFHYGFSFIKHFLSEDTRNKFVFLGSNWKQELLKVIDEKELPVHYGGVKTDPDGDEQCKSLIGTGGEVPEEFYLENGEDGELENSAQSIYLKKGDVHKVDFVVKSPESFIKWFVRSDRDLNVSITYKGKDSDEEKVMQPLSKTHCSKLAYRDTLLCEEPGTYTFVFDNKDSWWYDRNVKYNMTLLCGEDERQRLLQRGDEITYL